MNEEIKNKKIMINIFILEITIIIFYLALILVSCFTLKSGILLNLIVLISTIIFIINCIVLVKMEVSIGYHQCKNCKHIYTPTTTQAVMAIHMGTTRYMKCPKCGKKNWAKKVMSKDK